MGDKKWTLIGQTVTDHIKVPPTATHDNITRLLNNANNDWASIAKIVNKYEIKNGTHNSVIQRIRDIKDGKITSLSEITGNTPSTNDSTDSNTGTTSNGSTSGDASAGPLNSTVSRVPITNREDALEFAKTEWNKIRRTSGHSLEVQVFGSQHWRVGEWCKIYLPTLNEYTDMYITKVDNSNDSGSEWLTSLTLMDYAPSLSQLDEEDIKDAENTGDGTSNGGTGEESTTSKWTEIAQILQDNYEKPSDGWDNHIKTILGAKKYDPDIKNSISSLTKKQGKETTSYVDVGHSLCKVVGITY